MLKPSQMKYISERLDKSFADKRELLLSNETAGINKLKDEAVKKGNYTIKRKESYYRSEVSFEVEFPKLDKVLSALKATREEKELKLRAKMIEIKDEIMLGDEKQALEALKKFEALTL